MSKTLIMYLGGGFVALLGYFLIAYSLEDITDKLIVAFGMAFLWAYSYSKLG